MCTPLYKTLSSRWRCLTCVVVDNWISEEIYNIHNAYCHVQNMSLQNSLCLSRQISNKASNKRYCLIGMSVDHCNPSRGMPNLRRLEEDLNLLIVPRACIVLRNDCMLEGAIAHLQIGDSTSDGRDAYTRPIFLVSMQFRQGKFITDCAFRRHSIQGQSLAGRLSMI